MASPTFEQVYPELYKGWDREAARQDFLAGNWTNKAGADQFLGGADEGAGQEFSVESATQQLEDEFADVAISIDQQLQDIGHLLALSPEERDQIMQQAIEEVAPYYDKKRQEIETGIKEGKIQNAEDLLLQIRETRAEVENKLERYDLEQAETEEELVDTLADITSTTEEELESKRFEWKDRIDKVKTGQVQGGTLTSGIGRKRIGDLLNRRDFEKDVVQRRAQSQKTDVQREAKFDKKRIQLAREQAREERVRKLGAPAEEQETVSQTLGATDYGSMDELPSQAEIQRQRGQSDTRIYQPGALDELQERRKLAQEKMRQELEAEELATGRTEWEERKRDILSREAKANKNLAGSLYKRFS